MRNAILHAVMVTAVWSTWVWAADPIVPQPKPGEPLTALTAEQLERFEAGKLLFNKVFIATDGLGPIFNKDSCGGCHSSPAAGGSGNIKVTRFGLAEKEGFDPLDYLGGSLLQSQSISEECAEVVPPEANITANRVTNNVLGDGLVEIVGRLRM